MNDQTLLRRARRMLTSRIEHVIDWRIDNRIPPQRLAEYDRLLAEAAERLAEDRKQLDEQAGLLDELRGRLDEAHGRIDELWAKADWSANELERIIPHIAAQESQLDALHQKLTATAKPKDGEIEQARSLIEEVRREHAQIRTRLTGLSRYEERLSRLEGSD
ncbi:hypothetical protein [Sciscionella marina]|uniref:hypothetical protein n=1 Tax=Sciscionella marina TaxID=508770 RepID=UPI00037780CF|nr:hypothetical protein [Sciscionella marina]